MLENLDRLKTFHYVFSTGSVVEAANLLHVTQPAVSQAIQKLEGEIQTPLFIRQHKKLIPTSAGERLFAVVQPFMDELDSCLKTLAHSKDSPFGELRIGAPSEFGKTYLPVIMAGFRDKYPDVTFALEFAQEFALSGGLVQSVEEGKMDFALIDSFMINSKLFTPPTLLHFEPVFEETVILACSQQYYVENIQGKPTLEGLSQLDFIEYTAKARTVNHWFRHHYDVAKVPFRTVLTVDNHDAVINAIKHHTGLGMLASHLVDEEIQNGEIVPINTGKKDILNQIALIFLQDKVLTLTEQVFKDCLVGEIRQLGL